MKKKHDWDYKGLYGNELSDKQWAILILTYIALVIFGFAFPEIGVVTLVVVLFCVFAVVYENL